MLRLVRGHAGSPLTLIIETKGLKINTNGVFIEYFANISCMSFLHLTLIETKVFADQKRSYKYFANISCMSLVPLTLIEAKVFPDQ